MAGAHRAALRHPHVRARVSFHECDLSRFQAAHGEISVGGPLLFDPGQRWHYGTSIDVVGKLVEKVSARNSKTISASTSSPAPDVGHVLQRAAGEGGAPCPAHQRAGDRMDGAIGAQSRSRATVPAPIGGGGLVSTASDYVVLDACC